MLTKITAPIHGLIVLSVISLLLNNKIYSQNLIPDQGFEITKPTSTCNRPDASFDNLAKWYALNLNPDLFSSSCPFDEADFIYWSESTMAPEGSNYVGLWSRWNSDQTYKTEGIAIELDQPLKAGTSYSLNMKIFNRGEFQGLVASCILKPDKHIDIYLSTDSIKIENNFSNGTASTSATLVSSIRSSAVTAEKADDWEAVNTCFVATGGEKFLAIVLPLGDFGELPPCVASMATSGVFRSFYYFLDDVQLTEVSNEFSKDTLICQGEDFIVDLSDLFDTSLLEDASFEWDDGSSESYRILTNTKEHLITAQTECGEIPLSINLKTEDCSENLYIPNVFDPSSSGENNSFTIINTESSNLSDYRLSVYDRWGTLLFESRDAMFGWDGTSQNKEVKPGVYSWQLSYQTNELNEIVTKHKRGEVLLIR